MFFSSDEIQDNIINCKKDRKIFYNLTEKLKFFLFLVLVFERAVIISIDWTEIEYVTEKLGTNQVIVEKIKSFQRYF